MVLDGATTAMIFHVVVLDPEASQQAAMANGGSALAPFGPVVLPAGNSACWSGEYTVTFCCDVSKGPTGDVSCWSGTFNFLFCCPSPVSPPASPPPAPPSTTEPAGGAVVAQEFRRVCTTANLATCVPECNAVTYGFLLSIEIDGKGTVSRAAATPLSAPLLLRKERQCFSMLRDLIQRKGGLSRSSFSFPFEQAIALNTNLSWMQVMTCNKMGQLFSWQGQASLGGYIGEDFEAFFSSVVSGAAGTYLATLLADAGISTGLTIQPGQAVVVSGGQSLAAAPAWGTGGFSVLQFGSLSLSNVSLAAALSVTGGGSLSLSGCVLAAAITVDGGTASLDSCSVDAAVSPCSHPLCSSEPACLVFSSFWPCAPSPVLMAPHPRDESCRVWCAGFARRHQWRDRRAQRDFDRGGEQPGRDRRQHSCVAG